MPTTLNNWHKHQIKRREKVKLKKDDRKKTQQNMKKNTHNQPILAWQNTYAHTSKICGTHLNSFISTNQML